MGRASRWEYLRQIHPRYRKASREEKGRILDEFCAVMRYNRKYALRVLNGPPPERRPRRRRPRRPSYSPRVVSILTSVWEAAGYPWSVRLKALLPLWLPWVRKHFSLTPRLEEQLLRISPRQIDRRLREEKKRAGRRLYGRTKPGSLLKHHVPIKTDRWDVKQPGYSEIDLVSHSGNCATGGRPYKKDDNAHVEQKNWTHVRKLMGWVRYDTQTAVSAMNRLYRGDLRLLHNLFLPSVKLVRKERVGSRTRRRYDAAKTPLDRVLECKAMRPMLVARLSALRDRLDPFALSPSVDVQLDGIHALANHRRSPQLKVKATPVARSG